MRNVWLFSPAVAALASTGALTADPALVPSIYKGPAAPREAAPWTGLYGGVNARYGWGNQSVQETGDAVTGGQQAVNARASLLCSLAIPRASSGAVSSALIIKLIAWFWGSRPTGSGRI
jgi:hypothetical protein